MPVCPITQQQLAPGQTISADGKTQFVELIHQLPGLCEDLFALEAKQLRTPDKTAGRRSNHHPLPLNIEGMETLRDTEHFMWAWWHEHTTALGQLAAYRDTRQWVNWHTNNLPRIAALDTFPTFWDETQTTIQRATTVLTPPDPGRFAGTCCGHNLTATPWQTIIHCPTCDTAYNIKNNRATMLTKASTDWYDSNQVRALLRLQDIRISNDQLKNWAKRGQIPARKHDGKNYYRLADIIERINKK